eukprot:gene17798-12749_t
MRQQWRRRLRVLGVPPLTTQRPQRLVHQRVSDGIVHHQPPSWSGSGSGSCSSPR